MTTQNTFAINPHATIDQLGKLVTEAMRASDEPDELRDQIIEMYGYLYPNASRTLSLGESLAWAIANEPNDYKDTLETLRQSRMCIEGEAYSCGQMNARRIIANVPDWHVLSEMVSRINSYQQPGAVVDLDFFCDDDFKADLNEYPPYLRSQVFEGLFTEILRIHSEVTA